MVDKVEGWRSSPGRCSSCCKATGVSEQRLRAKITESIRATAKPTAG
jgi:hypothetical protein